MSSWPLFAWAHPGLILIAGALLLPLIPARVQPLYQVALPTLILTIIFSLTHGTYGEFEYLGLRMITGRVDALSLVFAYVFGIILVIGAIFALHLKDTLQHVAGYTYAGAALGVVFAGDMATLYVFWEIMAIASVWLIWARRNEVSWAAGWRYLLVHAAGGVILLAGITLYFVETGSTAFAGIASVGPAFYLILVGFMINAAVPPLHAWLPDAYPEATITGAILLASFTTKTAVYTLIRGYPGTELLVWFGAVMALYGVVYAVLANDIRRLLAYHIISQVGYMVAAVGMGTAMALNGATAHAFTHILYKALLFMGAGAVIHMTGKSKLTELGGLYRAMPLTFVLYMIGAFSISAFPLFSGFVSKTMVVEAAALDHRAIIWLMLSMASAGTFLHTGLKLPYFTFLGADAGLRPKEAPTNMLVAMGVAAFLCLFIGMFPSWLYALMPTPVTYNAYTTSHVIWELQLLLFTGLGFFVLLKHVGGEPKISLDTDWFYRRPGRWLARGFDDLTAGAWIRLVSGINGKAAKLHDLLLTHHGPSGTFGRTWPTGTMAFWTTLLLGAFLLIAAMT